MVKTASDILDANPIDRIDKLSEISTEKKDSIALKKKELEELEKTKKAEFAELDERKRKEMEELEEKKKRELENLDKKRKELKDLETQKIKEIEETQELIEKSFQDLMRHKRILLKEEDEENIKKSSSKTSDLETVANTAPTNIDIIPNGANANYSKFFEGLQEPQRLYEITNNQFYSGLTELRNKAANGEITPEEELFIERLKSRFEQFNSNETYIEKDQNQYVKRSMNIIEQIGKYHRLKD